MMSTAHSLGVLENIIMIIDDKVDVSNIPLNDKSDTKCAYYESKLRIIREILFDLEYRLRSELDKELHQEIIKEN